jgi:hypothetical protein
MIVRSWFGTALLAVQFWDLYSICIEKIKTLAEVWVDGELRVTFRRTFSYSMMQKWEELVSVVEQVELSDDTDALVWCYESPGVFSSHSCYNIISYRGVKHVYIPTIWEIVVPPRIHLFLWLLSYNKLSTVDNLNKKCLDKNTICCFCGEPESISHLLFECVVAKVVWSYIREVLGIEIEADYLSVAAKWLQKEKIYCVNAISAVLRGIWLIRNDMLFNKQVWSSMTVVLRKIMKILGDWKIICKEKKEEIAF